MDAETDPPDTPAARAALAVAVAYLTPSLLNHSIRSWRWALGFAELDAVGPIDEELLYVGAVLHDISLLEPFDAHRTPFEHAGGAVASVLAAGAGWDGGRRAHLAAAIVAHMSPDPVPAGGVEGRLLDVATSLDIAGARPDALPLDYRVAVLAAYPRLDLAHEFARLAADQAERKPASQAARIVRGGVAAKLTANPLERLE
ncbi:HD domain-containing protein [Pseudolysinimonas kribbensis]|uniref:cyanamide hydratase n=1 Tax=Pseudolysinimonas kribbensis TaxID=433641 RepID=UPI0031D041BB